MICPNCGNQAPEGSRFCNKCGTPLSQKQCPACHSMIPADSIFCPHCRQMVRTTTTATRGEKQVPVATESWRNEQQGVLPGNSQPAQQPAQQPYRQPQPQRQQPQQNYEPQRQQYDEIANDNYEPKKSNKMLYIIGAALLAFLTLIVVRNCFFSEKKKENSIVSTEIPDTPDRARDIFTSALNQNNLRVDGDQIAYALRTSGTDGKSGDTIVGVTWNTNVSPTVYKVYTFSANGSAWECKHIETKTISGRDIDFEPQRLRSNGDVPQLAKIDGKEYFYYAYLNMPQGGQGGTGRVSAALLNIATGTIDAQIDFDGPIATSPENGKQIEVESVNNRSGALYDFLRDHARNIGCLKFLSQEEIDKRREEDEKEKEERELADPANADRRWNHDNEEVQTALDNGEEVRVNVTQYDKSKPLFKADDFSSKINGPDHVVFLCKNGVVYAFNKKTDKNCVVYAGSPRATQIGWQDSKRGILNIRTSAGRRQYDLVNNRLKRTTEEPQQKEESKAEPTEVVEEAAN